MLVLEVDETIRVGLESEIQRPGLGGDLLVREDAVLSGDRDLAQRNLCPVY